MTVKAPARRGTWHDAYDAQMELWRWYRTVPGMQHIAASSRAVRSQVVFEQTKATLEQLHEAELHRLLDLDPIFVSAEMCEVITAAAETFQPEPLLETDLITPRGFMYLESPFMVYDRWDRPACLRAFSWTRMYASDKASADEAEALMRGGWEGDAKSLEEYFLEQKNMDIMGIALTIYAEVDAQMAESLMRRNEELRKLGHMPKQIPFHLTPWYFGMSFDGNEIDEEGKPTGAAWWWGYLQTTFRLMQQRIAVKHIQRPDRAARREAKRIGRPEEPEVVVVRLRREQSEAKEPTGEEANYSHRFIVSGHWRNQWYPSAGVHRQIWISPYVKGPEEMPLIVRPRRVYTWDR